MKLHKKYFNILLSIPNKIDDDMELIILDDKKNIFDGGRIPITNDYNL